MPVFSIVVPVYNAQDYVEEALESIAEQTFGDFEAIVVDDGSSDDSGRIVEAFCARDPRFSYVRRENGGPSAARNAGTALATGTYLYYLDSDDKMDPDTLRVCYDEFARRDVDVVLFDAMPLADDAPPPAWFEAAGLRPRVASPLSSGAFIVESVRQGRYIAQPCCFVARRSAIGNLQFIDGILFEDNHFFAALLLERKIMVSVLERALFKHRLTPNSIMTSRRTLRHYDSLYRLLHEMSALSFAALDPAPRAWVRSFVIGNLLGDLHSTSSQIGAGFAMRMKNLAAIWHVATRVSPRIVTLKRILLALVPELYRIKA